jgi:serine/threonine protein kinase
MIGLQIFFLFSSFGMILIVIYIPGYRFFVLERMDSTISSVVPLLLKSKSKTMNFGQIAVKLLECVRAVHESKNIIRDVKTENFMLALDSEASGSTLEKKISSRIRLIDLAMATQWTTMYYETDEGDSIIGTPLYASLNAHSGKKTSFRDDLESLGYVIAEILMQLYAGDPSKELTWSKGSSDEEIGEMKQSLIDDENSEFYLQLGNAKTIAVFSEYMEIVRGYSFKKVPDYDELSEVLSKLTILKKNSAASSSSRGPSSSKKSVSSKRTRSKVSITTTDAASPSKTARRNTRSTRSKKKDIDMVVENPTNELDESFDETVYHDAHQDVEEMDWEYTVDENEEPKEEEPKEESKPRGRTRPQRDPALRRQRTTRSGKAGEHIVIDDDNDKEKESSKAVPSRLKLQSSKAVPSRLKRRGVTILCVEGPHEGESYEIEAGVNEIVIVGSEPSSSVGEVLTLKKDKMLQATHVRLDLSINRRVTAVKVTDKSKGETYVNRHPVKSTKAFINDTIKIGDTSFKIQPL